MSRYTREYCNDKLIYTKKEAETVRNARTSRGKNRKSSRPAKGLRIYQCPDCGFYHLTKKL